MNAISVDFHAVIIPVASCVGARATFHSYKSSQEGQSTLSPSHCPWSSHVHGWGKSLQHSSLGYLAQVLLLGTVTAGKKVWNKHITSKTWKCLIWEEIGKKKSQQNSLFW